MRRLRRDFHAATRPEVTFPEKLSNAEILTTRHQYRGAYDFGLGKCPVLVQVTTRTIFKGPLTDQELLRAWEHLTNEEIQDAIDKSKSMMPDGVWRFDAYSFADGICALKDRDAGGRHSREFVLDQRERVLRLRGGCS